MQRVRNKIAKYFASMGYTEVHVFNDTYAISVDTFKDQYGTEGGEVSYTETGVTVNACRWTTPKNLLDEIFGNCA